MNEEHSNKVFVIETVLLLAGPVLSLVYALAAAIFLGIWGESTSIWEHIATLVPRNTLSVVAWCIALQLQSAQGDSDTRQGLRLLLVVASLTAASYYFMRQTRLQVLVGGQEPAPANLEGQVIVLTGANAGIGKETARQLVQRGATVILACRSVERANSAIQDIQESVNDQENEQDVAKPTARKGNLYVQQLDLTSLESVRSAAKQILSKHKTIDTLICNAGLMTKDYSMTKDGYELVLQANYIGHYLLTRLLLPALKRSSQPRLVWVSSSTYKLAGTFSLDDPFCQSIRSYSLFGQYAYSKLAQILCLQEFAKRNDIFCAVLHPGLVRTDVVKHMPWYLLVLNNGLALILKTLQKTPQQGAWNTVYCSITNDLPTGQYWVNQHFQALTPAASDLDMAQQLYRQTAQWVGLDPDK